MNKNKFFMISLLCSVVFNAYGYASVYTTYTLDQTIKEESADKCSYNYKESHIKQKSEGQSKVNSSPSDPCFPTYNAFHSDDSTTIPVTTTGASPSSIPVVTPPLRVEPTLAGALAPDVPTQSIGTLHEDSKSREIIELEVTSPDPCADTLKSYNHISQHCDKYKDNTGKYHACVKAEFFALVEKMIKHNPESIRELTFTTDEMKGFKVTQEGVFLDDANTTVTHNLTVEVAHPQDDSSHKNRVWNYLFGKK